MAIIVVRHGETDGNATRVLQRPDIPLNARGLQQAECLAERLATHPVQHILCSDLRRAQMTAQPIASRLGLAIETSPLLAERNFGDLRGVPYHELPGDPFAPNFEPPNGETWAAFHARVEEAFALIVATRERAPGGDLLVVTHGLVCRALLQRHLRAGEGSTLAPLALGNTAVTLCDDDAPYQVRLLGCAQHLASLTPREAALGEA